MNAQLKIPASTFDLELVPGGIKKVKTENRRADAMSWMDRHVSSSDRWSAC